MQADCCFFFPFPFDIAECFMWMSAEVLVNDCDTAVLLFCNYPHAFERANWKEFLCSECILMHVHTCVATGEPCSAMCLVFPVISLSHQHRSLSTRQSVAVTLWNLTGEGDSIAFCPVVLLSPA